MGTVRYKLCYAAAYAALGGRSDAAFNRVCAALADLGTTAVPGLPAESRGIVLCLLSDERLAEDARQYDGDMLSVHQALQQQLGWDGQQAAAALLQGIGMATDLVYPATHALASWTECPARHARSLLSTTAEHIGQVAAMLG